MKRGNELHLTRHKNTMFIKPHNFDILFSLHNDRTVILV